MIIYNKKILEDKKMNDMTKKLQKLVGHRKNAVVVSKQKDFKQYKRNKGSAEESDYSSGSFDNN